MNIKPMENKVLITGGSGRLGTELKKIWPYEDYPTRQELDITKPIKKGKYLMVIHCAGYTNIAVAEQEKGHCFDINVTGTKNLVEAYMDIPFVFISSEYAVSPVNQYAYTKRLGELEVAKHPRHLIIRTLFKPKVWLYKDAYIDQHTMGDTVDIIAKLIKDKITSWDGVSNIIYVGTGRKTIFDIAKKSNSSVKPCSINKLKFKIPSDYI